MGGGGGGAVEVQKKKFMQGKIKWKKNSWTPINPKKYSCYSLKKIHTRNLITKKNSCDSKIPLPRKTFLMVRPLIAVNRQKLQNLTVNRQNWTKLTVNRKSYHPTETHVK